MLFSEILGHEHIKNHLIRSASQGRIPHAQLFIGPEGTGTLAMAIAYAQYIVCQNSGSDNTGENEACNLKFNHLGHPDLHFIYPTVSTEDVNLSQKALILFWIGGCLCLKIHTAVCLIGIKCWAFKINKVKFV